jgi:hypothetical protein
MGEDRAKATISEANESHGQAVKVFQAVAATTVTIASKRGLGRRQSVKTATGMPSFCSRGAFSESDRGPGS